MQEGYSDPSPPAWPRPLRSGHREGRCHPGECIGTSGHPGAIGRERPGAGGQENDLRSAPAEPSEGEGASAGQASGPCQLPGTKPSHSRVPARVSTGMLTGPRRESLAMGRALPPSPGFPAVTQAAARGHSLLTRGYDLAASCREGQRQGQRGRQPWQSSWDDLSAWGGTHGSGCLAQGQAYHHRPGKRVLRMDTPPNSKNLLDLPGKSQAAQRVCLVALTPSFWFISSSALCLRLGFPDTERGSVEGKWVGKDDEESSPEWGLPGGRERAQSCPPGGAGPRPVHLGSSFPA